MRRFPSLERGPAFWLALKSNSARPRGNRAQRDALQGLAKWWGVLFQVATRSFFTLPLPAQAGLTVME